jgi:hypothetical protein
VLLLRPPSIISCPIRSTLLVVVTTTATTTALLHCTALKKSDGKRDGHTNLVSSMALHVICRICPLFSVPLYGWLGSQVLQQKQIMQIKKQNGTSIITNWPQKCLYKRIVVLLRTTKKVAILPRHYSPAADSIPASQLQSADGRPDPEGLILPVKSFRLF